MKDNVLKYRTRKLIILYYYIYSKLLGTVGNIIWNFIGLMRSIESGSQINR